VESKDEIEASLERERIALGDADQKLVALTDSLGSYQSLDGEVAAEHGVEVAHGADFQAFLQNEPDSTQLEEREKNAAEALASLQEARRLHKEGTEHLAESRGAYDPQRHQEVRRLCREIGERRAGQETGCRGLERELARVEQTLEELVEQERRLASRREEREGLSRTERALRFVRETIREAGPAVTGALLRNISAGANEIYTEIVDDHAVELKWNQEYDVVVQRGSEERGFAQLSGGEQMSAALSVRLALLKEMSEVDFAFFDEPTQNMDADRRSNLADQIGAVRGFEQLIIISHDDTFEHHTDNLIRLHKVDQQTMLETA
jgi:exonuclease SbcC